MAARLRASAPGSPPGTSAMIEQVAFDATAGRGNPVATPTTAHPTPAAIRFAEVLLLVNRSTCAPPACCRRPRRQQLSPCVRSEPYPEPGTYPSPPAGRG